MVICCARAPCKPRRIKQLFSSFCLGEQQSITLERLEEKQKKGKRLAYRLLLLFLCMENGFIDSGHVPPEALWGSNKPYTETLYVRHSELISQLLFTFLNYGSFINAAQHALAMVDKCSVIVLALCEGHHQACWYINISFFLLLSQFIMAPSWVTVLES